jgi:hypothetical protein
VGRHLLNEFASPAITQVLSNPGRPERVIADPRLDPRYHCAPADHPIDVRLGEGIASQETIALVP